MKQTAPVLLLALLTAFGTAAGIPNEGTAGLTAEPVRTLEDEQPGSFFGQSVATAGDVNGDGHSDVIVGAPGGATDFGNVVLYLGNADGLSTFPAWTMQGEQAGDGFGSSVAPAGDVNGDGFDDVLVGAPFLDTAETNEGRAYLYLGSADGLEPLAAWTVDGSEAGANFGHSVAWAGDVNRDGFADIAVGAPGFDQFCGTDCGLVQAFYGSATGPSTTADWEPLGSELAGTLSFGWTVAAGGDVNGDGFGDLIVGAPDTDIQTGRVSVYAGSGSGLNAPAIWAAVGVNESTRFGETVSTAGDVNGDGISDLLVGASGQDCCGGNQTSDELAYVFFGPLSGGVQVTADAADWSVQGPEDPLPTIFINAIPQAQDFAESVAAAGDVNGDGFSDLVVGAPRLNRVVVPVVALEDAGGVFLYLGSSNGPSQVADWSLIGETTNGLLGESVLAAGDIDADGFGDLIVGAPGLGHALVFGGKPGALLSPAGTWTDRGGRAVAAAGDINADGFSDVLAYTSTAGPLRAWYGGPTGPERVNWMPQNPGFPGPAGDVNGDGRADVLATGFDFTSGLESILVYLGCPEPGFLCEDFIEFMGWSVPGTAGASAGDVNADGFGDVIVENAGAAEIYLGSPTGLPDTAAWTIPIAGGSGVASAGDVNADGFGDVVIGHAVHFGSASGPSQSAVWSTDSGTVTSAGDVNGDGLSDLLAFGDGLARIYLAAGDGISLIPDWTAKDDEAPAFAAAAASAGDINNDGFGDVIVGSPGVTGPFGLTLYAGRAFLFLGSPNGPLATSSWFVLGDEEEATFGSAVSAAGDINGDGFGDVIVGADVFGTAQVADVWYLYHGNASAGDDGLRRATAPRQLRNDSDDLIAPGGVSDSETGFRIDALAQNWAGGGAALSWEVAPFGEPLDGSATQRGAIQPAGARVVQTIDNLFPGVSYHWRVRSISGSPFFPATSWISLPGSTLAQAKLRTAGALPAKPFEVAAPPRNARFTSDSQTVSFAWQTGGENSFRIEWSRNPLFAPPVVSADVASDHPEWGAYRPDDATWRQILELGQTVDFTDIPIFWRVAPANATAQEVDQLEIRTIRVAAAEPPVLLSPTADQEVLSSAAPILSWDANGSEEFQLRFSSNSHIGDPRVIVSEDYSIDSSEWQVPDTVWSDVVALSLRNAGGEVYWVVLGRDALGRTSFSRIQRFRVVDGITSAVPEGARPGRTSRGGRQAPLRDRRSRP